MGEIRIERHRRKSFMKDVKRGPGIKMRRIRGTTVKGHMRPDVGEKGRTPKRERWAVIVGNLHGWSKDMSTDERRRRAAIGRDDLSSARALQQLTNLSTDRKTKIIAKSDADYFFAKHNARK